MPSYWSVVVMNVSVSVCFQAYLLKICQWFLSQLIFTSLYSLDRGTRFVSLSSLIVDPKTPLILTLRSVYHMKQWIRTQEKSLTAGSLDRDCWKCHFPTDPRNRDIARDFLSLRLPLGAFKCLWSENVWNTTAGVLIDWGKQRDLGSPQARGYFESSVWRQALWTPLHSKPASRTPAPAVRKWPQNEKARVGPVV